MLTKWSIRWQQTEPLSAGQTVFQNSIHEHMTTNDEKGTLCKESTESSSWFRAFTLDLSFYATDFFHADRQRHETPEVPYAQD